MDWLDEDLKCEIEKVFKPKYGRDLSDSEIAEIATNLVNYTEHHLKFIWNMRHE